MPFLWLFFWRFFHCYGLGSSDGLFLLFRLKNWLNLFFAALDMAHCLDKGGKGSDLLEPGSSSLMRLGLEESCVKHGLEH